MKAFAVVDLVDEPREVGGDILERLISRQVDGLNLQRLHEALRLGVVIRVAAAAHRADQAMCGQQLAIDLRRVLLGFNQSSQHQAEPIVAPGQTLRQAFASQASFAAWC